MPADPHSPYRAPAWLPGGHLQTIYPYLFRRLPAPRLERERWDTPDGDFVDVDWLAGPADAPLVVLFHGLEGSAHSHYARAMFGMLRARNWRGVLPHFRGCGGSPNRTARAYHSGDFAEIDWMLRTVASRAPKTRRFAVGVSLGGNALLKWLAWAGGDARDSIMAAAAVSAPMDLATAGHRLGRGINLLYGWNFLRTLKRKSLLKLERFPGLYDARAVARARSLHAFDGLVTAPLHGFRDTEHYWTSASSKPDLKHIGLPTLVLHARNDPFLPGEYLPAPDEVSKWVSLDFSDTGGHVGFVTGPFPGSLDWLPGRLLDFFESQPRGEPARAIHGR
jgi:predicted alpha/beta-fold hydrolase